MTTAQQNGNGSSDTASAAGVSAVVNPDPNGMVTRYTRDGIAIQIPVEHAGELEATFGLRADRYDLDECYNEWRAAHDAVGPVVEQFYQRAKDLQYLDPSDYEMLNAAQGAAVNSYQRLMISVGSTLPTEALIAAVRLHKDEVGTLDGIPALRKYEDLADRLPEDRVAVHRDLKAAGASA